MPETRAKANQAILEAQWLRMQGRALRNEAMVLANQLGVTMVRSRWTKTQVSDLRAGVDRSIATANACTELRAVRPSLAAGDEIQAAGPARPAGTSE